MPPSGTRDRAARPPRPREPVHTQRYGLGYAWRVADDSAYRMFVTGCAMTAATVVRTGVGCLELWSRRAPLLFDLDARSREGKAGARAAQAEFRDELIGLARDSSALAVRELRRGLDDLDAFTRPAEEPAARSRRPYKAKR